MKKTILGWMFAVAAWMALPAFGQDGELFNKLDANQDGVITSDEVPDDKQGLFARLVRLGDANGDKKLTKDEFSAALKKSTGEGAPAAGQAANRPAGVPGLAGAAAKEIFARLDKDGNGKIEKGEIPERMQENLARIDTNGDGAVDLAEFEKVAQFFGSRAAETAPEGRAGQGGPVPPGMLLLRALDADGDGELSASEIADAPKALARLDRNGDGKVTRDELTPPGLPGRPGEGNPARPAAAQALESFMRRMIVADANGDKKLSREEAPDRIKENFDRLDTNQDGQLDYDELKSLFERMRPGAGDQPKRRPEERKKE
jgi:Ca2+-binding EF-hand superfamily protein